MVSSKSSKKKDRNTWNNSPSNFNAKSKIYNKKIEDFN